MQSIENRKRKMAGKFNHHPVIYKNVSCIFNHRHRMGENCKSCETIIRLFFTIIKNHKKK